MKNSNCLILIPAFNESKNIGEVLRGIRDMNIEVDILVINDGSTDQTADVVKKADEEIINLPYNLGYGGALQTGFKYAAIKGYQYVLQFDADGQHDSSNIPQILEELRTGNYDIIIGSRFLASGVNISLLKRMAILLFRLLIKLFTGNKITDPTSGLQGLTRRAYTHYALMGNYPEDFPDADTLIASMILGFRIKEIPANFRNRYSGKGMHSGLSSGFYLLKMLVSILVVLLRRENKDAGVIN